ncbi:DUF4381 domain-containing protein [Colwellia sp. E2M01]|nr:DUF4381 domain-containing protein [Colwellia sp. E2M01]
MPLAQGQMPGQAPTQSIQLHDIHLPEQVNNFPIAPGWWILLTLIVITVIWCIKKYQHRKQLHVYKKQALTALANNPTMSAKESITLLKWAAMKYFSRQQLAKLYGESFQKFLVEQLPEKYQKNFTELSHDGFAEQYQADASDSLLDNASESLSNAIPKVNRDSDCYQAAKLWLTHALPVKKTTKKQNEKPSKRVSNKVNKVESQKEQNA